MDDRQLARRPDLDDLVTGPLDREGRDGVAGRGDMLGGTSTGAGGRLGPDAAEDREGQASANQHSFAGEEAATDGGRTYHGASDPV